MSSVLKESINKDKLPTHIAIIMDGNGRWAEIRGNQRIFGHKNAVAAVRDTVEASAELGVQYLTLYAFSTENWKRPKNEVDALMALLVSTIHSETKTLLENNIRLHTIGNTGSLPATVQKQLVQAKEKTAGNTGLNLILALSYGSRWEIINAVKNLTAEIEKGNISSKDINESLFEKFLDTSGFPDPELIIRTSGEYRISNFLLWQIAYTELYFTPTLWPDFRREHLYEAILNFQNRERRFGKTAEQIKRININS
ncbi:MAG TPA: isoprenyl transferase [Bacteroidales bacterium]|jgi:undecaprenyl diphosphate synthase|nr:isoprenyl transferase [Bacteroidales bacterium]